MCSRLEIKDFDELVFFHPDAERMTRQANDFLTLLQKLNPGLCTPKQTSCICLQCLKTIKEHFDKVRSTSLKCKFGVSSSFATRYKYFRFSPWQKWWKLPVGHFHYFRYHVKIFVIFTNLTKNVVRVADFLFQISIFKLEKYLYFAIPSELSWLLCCDGKWRWHPPPSPSIPHRNWYDHIEKGVFLIKIKSFILWGYWNVEWF